MLFEYWNSIMAVMKKTFIFLKSVLFVNSDLFEICNYDEQLYKNLNFIKAIFTLGLKGDCLSYSGYLKHQIVYHLLLR